MLCVARAVIAAADPLAAFDEEMLENFPRFLKREGAVVQILFQIRTEQDVYPADAGPVAAEAQERETEPQRLHRLAEIPRRLVRHAKQSFIVRPVLRLIAQGVEVSFVPDIEAVEDGKAAFHKRFLFRSLIFFVRGERSLPYAVEPFIYRCEEVRGEMTHAHEDRGAVMIRRYDVLYRVSERRGAAYQLAFADPDRRLFADRSYRDVVLFQRVVKFAIDLHARRFPALKPVFMPERFVCEPARAVAASDRSFYSVCRRKFHFQSPLIL